MSAIRLASLTFACAFGGALLGSYIRSAPPAGTSEQRVAGHHEARDGAGGDDDGASARPRDGFRAKHVRQPGRRDQKQRGEHPHARSAARAIRSGDQAHQGPHPPGRGLPARIDLARGRIGRIGSHADTVRGGDRSHRESDPPAVARQRDAAVVQVRVSEAERRGVEGAMASARQPGRVGSDSCFWSS